MFWNKFDSMLSKENSVHDIISAADYEKVVLKDLFEKEDCIQETKARYPLLIKVLTRPDILLQLVNHIAQEPPEDADAKVRFRDATIACEMLNADVPEIMDALVQGSGEYLDILFGYFASNAQLNPILTSFATRTLGLLIARKPNEMFEYLRRKNNLLDITLKHLNVAAVTDLYVRLITAHENDAFRYQMCEWLNSQKLLERVAEYLDVNFMADTDYHSNAAQLIGDVIRFSREQQLQQLTPDDKAENLTPETYANELLKTADSEEFTTLIISILLRCSNSQSSIVHCLAVLGAPFDFIPVNFDGNNEQKILFSELGFRVVNSRIEKYTRIFYAVIPQLLDILKNPPVRNSLIGELAKDDKTLTNRVGQTRVTLVRMFALLISFGRPQLNQAIHDSGALLTLLDMFFQFYWNSFFHLHVQNCINLIVRNVPMNANGGIPSEHPLLHQLLISGKLQQRIIDACKENDSLINSGKPRRPYMGHLLAICAEISPEQVAKNPMLQSILTDMDPAVIQEWNDFFTNNVKPLLDTHSRCLGGPHPLQQQNQPSLGQTGHADVGAFEYATKAPGLDESENMDPSFNVEHTGMKPTLPEIKKPYDAKMTERHKNEDEEMGMRDVEEDEDADMEGPIETGSSSHAHIPRSIAKTETGYWPSRQPLNVSEKVGLKRMEEAENSNSPWDVAMKPDDDPDDFWNAAGSNKNEPSNDAWADFSAFNSQGASDNVDAFFSSSHLSAQGSNSLDSEDGPFEFRAACLTPEPNDTNNSAPDLADEDIRPTGDIQMNSVSTSPPVDSPPISGSGDVGLSSSNSLEKTSNQSSHHT